MSARIALCGLVACSHPNELSQAPEAIGAARSELTLWTTSCNNVPPLDATQAGTCEYGGGFQWGGALGNGIADDALAIQSALNCAHATRQELYPAHPTCRVDVVLPPGVYRTTETLWLPSGTGLVGLGDSPSATVIRKIPGTTHSAMNFGSGPPNYGFCDKPRAIRVENLRIQMRDSDSSSSLPMAGGHCIRGSIGGEDIDLLKLNLNACSSYGVGLQYDPRNCIANDKSWRRITVDSVKIISGSDGIDMKSAYEGANSHVNISRVCIRDVGWNDDGGSAAGLDLAGRTIHVSGFKFVNPTHFYEHPDAEFGITSVVGIRFRTGERNVSDCTVDDFYIKRVGKGIHWDGSDNHNILIAHGKVTEVPNTKDLNGNLLMWGDGYYVRGDSHFTSGYVCATNVGRSPLHVAATATNIHMYMTECPYAAASVADEACGY